MANTKQAIKMIRVAEKRRQRNRPIKTAVKNVLRKANEAIESNAGAGETAEAILAAVSQLDRAASKGVLHANNVARRKSRLMKRLHGAQAAAKS